jgi:hypothetical protein
MLYQNTVFYHTENLHPLGYPATAAMLRDVLYNYGCETWPLTLSEEQQRLNAFQDRVMRRLHGHSSIICTVHHTLVRH